MATKAQYYAKFESLINISALTASQQAAARDAWDKFAEVMALADGVNGLSAYQTHDGYVMWYAGEGIATAGTGDLYWDRATGKLGIHTASPNEFLTIKSGAISLGTTEAPSTTAGYGKVYVKSDGLLYYKTPGGVEYDLIAAGGSGGITGPATSTDNAIVLWNGTTGDLVKNSTVTIDEYGNLTVANIIISGTVDDEDISNLGDSVRDCIATLESLGALQDGYFNLTSAATKASVTQTWTGNPTATASSYFKYLDKLELPLGIYAEGTHQDGYIISEVAISEDASTIGVVAYCATTTSRTSYVYISEDSGENWHHVTNIPTASWRYISISSNGSHVLISGKLDTIWQPPGPNPFYIYLSHNAGDSWENISPIAEIDGDFYTKLSSSGTTVMCACEVDYGSTRYYKSTNSGASWTYIDYGSERTNVVYSDNGQYILSGTLGAGCYLSKDYGATFTGLSTGFEEEGGGPNIYGGITAWNMSKDGSTIVYGGSQGNIIDGDITYYNIPIFYISTDYGESFYQLDVPTPAIAFSDNDEIIYRRYKGIGLDNDGSTIILFESLESDYYNSTTPLLCNVYVSTDGGSSWDTSVPTTTINNTSNGQGVLTDSDGQTILIYGTTISQYIYYGQHLSLCTYNTQPIAFRVGDTYIIDNEFVHAGILEDTLDNIVSVFNAKDGNTTAHRNFDTIVYTADAYGTVGNSYKALELTDAEDIYSFNYDTLVDGTDAPANITTNGYFNFGTPTIPSTGYSDTGDTIFGGDVEIVGSLMIRGDVLPNRDNEYDIGSPTKRIHHIYAGSNSVTIGEHSLSTSGDTLEIASEGVDAVLSVPKTETQVIKISDQAQSKLVLVSTDTNGNATWGIPAREMIAGKNSSPGIMFFRDGGIVHTII